MAQGHPSATDVLLIKKFSVVEMKEPIVGPYHEPVESSSHPYILYLEKNQFWDPSP
jgi:hypothetical protein